MDKRILRKSKTLFAAAEMLALLACTGCSFTNPLNFPNDDGMERTEAQINEYAEIKASEESGNEEEDKGVDIETFYAKELDSLYQRIEFGSNMKISLDGDPMNMEPEYTFNENVEGELTHLFADMDKDGENELVLIRIAKNDEDNYDAIVEIYDKDGNKNEMMGNYILKDIYCGYEVILDFYIIESENYSYIGLYHYYSVDLYFGQSDSKYTFIGYRDGKVLVDDSYYDYSCYSGYGSDDQERKLRYRNLGLVNSADCGGWLVKEDGVKNICGVYMNSSEDATVATVDFKDNSGKEYSDTLDNYSYNGSLTVFIDEETLIKLSEEYPNMMLDCNYDAIEYDLSRYFGEGIYHLQIDYDTVVCTDTVLSFNVTVVETGEDVSVKYTWKDATSYDATLEINGRIFECLSCIQRL